MDIFQTLPPQFFITYCGLFLLLSLGVLGLWYLRRRQSGTGERSAPVAAEDEPSNHADLPDLDMLLEPTGGQMRRSGGIQALRLANGHQIEAAEVVTILRDIASGGLIIQIGDKAYPVGAEGADAEFKGRFDTVMRELVRSSRAAKTAAPPAVDESQEVEDIPEVTHPTPELEREELQAAVEAPETEPSDEPAETTTMPPPGELPGDLPQYRLPDEPLGDFMGRKRVAKPDRKPIPELDIAGAIEAFLQHRLEETGAFQGRRIHVRRGVSGGVRIEVDGTFYESVDEIADGEVREFLQTTIQEWQGRHERKP